MKCLNKGINKNEWEINSLVLLALNWKRLICVTLMLSLLSTVSFTHTADLCLHGCSCQENSRPTRETSTSEWRCIIWAQSRTFVFYLLDSSGAGSTSRSNACGENEGEMNSRTVLIENLDMLLMWKHPVKERLSGL